MSVEFRKTSVSMQEFITNKVGELRIDCGVTQEDLAQAVGVSRQTIIALEKGKYTPSIMLALKIAIFFELPVEKIFTINCE